jgi:hypothetical protein
MMKRKAFWALLAVGMTVVSTVASAQRIDRETLTTIISRAGSRVAISKPESAAELPTVGMLGEFKKKSLVGSWVETDNFLDGFMKGRVLTALVSYHDDGTEMSSGQGSVMLDPPPKHQKDPQTGSVTSDGIGAWSQTDWRTFLVTEKDLFSDLSGTLTGFLKVTGTLTLLSADEYSGTSFFEVLDPDQNSLVPPITGSVHNSGKRIRVEPTPTP